MNLMIFLLLALVALLPCTTSGESCAATGWNAGYGAPWEVLSNPGQESKEACANLCLIKKKEDSSINGVSYIPTGWSKGHCACNKNMASRLPSYGGYNYISSFLTCSDIETTPPPTMPPTTREATTEMKTTQTAELCGKLRDGICKESSSELIRKVTLLGFSEKQCRAACKAEDGCAVFVLGKEGGRYAGGCYLLKEELQNVCTIRSGTVNNAETHALKECGKERTPPPTMPPTTREATTKLETTQVITPSTTLPPSTRQATTETKTTQGSLKNPASLYLLELHIEHHGISYAEFANALLQEINFFLASTKTKHAYKSVGERKVFVVMETSADDLDEMMYTSPLMTKMGDQVTATVTPLVAYETFVNSMNKRLQNNKTTYEITKPVEGVVGLQWVQVDIGYTGKTLDELENIWSDEADIALAVKKQGGVVDAWKSVGTRQVYLLLHFPSPDVLDQTISILPLTQRNGENVHFGVTPVVSFASLAKSATKKSS